MQRVKLDYFGYSVEFTTSENQNDVIRAEANRLVIEKHGPNPMMNYVEPGVPFPNYVPVQRWHEGDTDNWATKPGWY